MLILQRTLWWKSYLRTVIGNRSFDTFYLLKKINERRFVCTNLASLYHQMLFLVGQREVRPIKRLQSATLDPVSYWVRPYANREGERERDVEREGTRLFWDVRIGIGGFCKKKEKDVTRQHLSMSWLSNLPGFIIIAPPQLSFSII